MSPDLKADMLIAVAGACGIPPHEARQASVRDLELIQIAAAEIHPTRFSSE